MADTSKNVKMMLVLPNNDQESLVNAINYNFHQLANIANGVVAKQGPKGDPGLAGIQGPQGKDGKRGSMIYSYDGKTSYDDWRETLDIKEGDYIISDKGVMYKFNEDYHSISEYKQDDIAIDVESDIAESVIKEIGAKTSSPFTTYESETGNYHYATQTSYNKMTGKEIEGDDKYPIPVVFASGFNNPELSETIISGDGEYKNYSINSICGVSTSNIRLANRNFNNYSVISFENDNDTDGTLKFSSKTGTTCKYELYSGNDNNGNKIVSIDKSSISLPEAYKIKFGDSEDHYIKSDLNILKISSKSELFLEAGVGTNNTSCSISIKAKVITNEGCNSFSITDSNSASVFSYTVSDKQISIGGNGVNVVNINSANSCNIKSHETTIESNYTSGGRIIVGESSYLSLFCKYGGNTSGGIIVSVGNIISQYSSKAKTSIYRHYGFAEDKPVIEVGTYNSTTIEDTYIKLIADTTSINGKVDIEDAIFKKNDNDNIFKPFHVIEYSDSIDTTSFKENYISGISILVYDFFKFTGNSSFIDLIYNDLITTVNDRSSSLPDMIDRYWNFLSTTRDKRYIYNGKFKMNFNLDTYQNIYILNINGAKFTNLREIHLDLEGFYFFKKIVYYYKGPLSINAVNDINTAVNQIEVAINKAYVDYYVKYLRNHTPFYGYRSILKDNNTDKVAYARIHSSNDFDNSYSPWIFDIYATENISNADFYGELTFFSI